MGIIFIMKMALYIKIKIFALQSNNFTCYLRAIKKREGLGKDWGRGDRKEGCKVNE